MVTESDSVPVAVGTGTIVRYPNSKLFTLTAVPGTPGGVGHAMTPPVFLRPGQVVRTAIEGIGELLNPCVREMP